MGDWCAASSVSVGGKVLVPHTVRVTPVPACFDLVPYDVVAPLPREHQDAKVLVTWQNPREGLRVLARELRELRMVQSLSAGVDALQRAGFGEQVDICAGAGLHDVPVAEHALALVLSAARRLDHSVRAQDARIWSRARGSKEAETPRFTMVHGAVIAVWGFGGIGRQLAGYLRALGAHVTGIALSDGERDGFPVVSVENADELLSGSDVLVNTLPATPETFHAVGAHVFDLLPAHSWLVNVGRGMTVDEVALLKALDARSIGGAALDVFQAEPLPADHPLWYAPNVIVTPHVAGGRPQHPERLIAENLRRLAVGEPLIGLNKAGWQRSREPGPLR